MKNTIMVFSTTKKIRRKVFTDCKINRLRKELGLNWKYEKKMFAIRTEMKFLTLKKEI